MWAAGRRFFYILRDASWCIGDGIVFSLVSCVLATDHLESVENAGTSTE